MKRKIILFLVALTISSQASCFDGKLKWSTDIESSLSSSIAFHNGKLILGDSSGKLHALTASTGAELWDYEGSSSILGIPLIVGNNIIFAQADGELSRIDISGGSVLWRYIPGEDFSNMLNDGPAYGDGVVFAAYTDGTLSAIDALTCDDVWTYQAKHGLRTAPAYSEGLVFQGEYDGLFSIIDAKTGERLSGGGAGGAVNTPAVNDGKVYFSAGDGSVQSVQIKNVIPLWNVNVKDPVTTSPALGEGIIVIGTARGYIFALDETDGKILWHYETGGGSITAKPVIAEGLVFACSAGGVVHILDIKAGKELHRFTTNQVISTNPAYSDGVFYFGGDKGIIYALQ